AERLAGNAGDADAALGDDDVVGCSLEEVRRERPRLVEHEVRRLEHGAASELQRTRAAGAATSWNERGIRLDEPEVLDRDPEDAGRDGRVRGAVALAVRGGARLQGRGAVVVHLDLGEF